MFTALRRETPWLAVGIAGMALLAWLLTVATRFLVTEPEGRLKVVLAVVLLSLAMGLTLLFRLARRDWFHPLGFPLLYMAAIFVVPVLWILGTGRPIGNIQVNAVSTRLLVVFLATVLAFAVGALLLAGRGRRGGVEVPTLVDYRPMRMVGRVLLAAVAASRLAQLQSVTSIPYGQEQLDYDLSAWLSVVEGGLVFVGTILVVTANTQLDRAVLRKVDVLLLALFTIATFAGGSRGELVAPLLFIVWARHSYVKRLTLRQAVPATVLIVVLFQLVAVYRAEYELSDVVLPSGPRSFAEGGLPSISTPVLITGTVVQAVPHRHPFEHGQTYLMAMVRQLPGPVSVALFGPPDDTGMFVYRDIIGLDDPDIGFGFALPAEAYLNFGLPGVVGVGLLLGLAFAYGYRRQARVPSRPIHLLYPILVAVLPLGLRSDALFQIKLVLYPMLALALVYALCRRSARARVTVAGVTHTRSSPRLRSERLPTLR